PGSDSQMRWSARLVAMPYALVPIRLMTCAQLLPEFFNVLDAKGAVQAPEKDQQGEVLRGLALKIEDAMRQGGNDQVRDGPSWN
ncbi:MAG: hypothetical protein EBX72_13045, partial [Betaproteobacteria bacterium]|nr:hypothetical protein [Betaproteobacteria bacterium]